MMRNTFHFTIKNARYLAGAFLAAALLASCGHRPVKGFVVGKKHELAHSETRYDIVLKMPIVRSIPEQWILYVADSCGVTQCHVDSATFAKYDKGDYVSEKGRYYGKGKED